MCITIDVSELVLSEGAEPSFNLQKEYDEANRKYFDNKLKPIKLVYKRATGKLGWVKAQTMTDDRGRIKFASITFMAMNSRYNYTREQFLETFLHEMCHVMMLQNYTEYSWKGGYHNNEWKALAREVSNKSGVPITVSGDTANYSTKSEKEFIAIIALSYGRMSIARVSMGIWTRMADEWLTQFSRSTSTKYIVATSTDGRIVNFTRGSRNKPTFYQVDQKVATDILKNGLGEIEYYHDPNE